MCSNGFQKQYTVLYTVFAGFYEKITYSKILVTLLTCPQEDNFDPENPQKKVAYDTESFKKPLMNDHFEGFCPASSADWTPLKYIDHWESEEEIYLVYQKRIYNSNDFLHNLIAYCFCRYFSIAVEMSYSVSRILY
jgi:hypothetical protein